MVGRHRASSARLRRVRWLAAGAGLVAAAVVALALTPSARAASDPTPNYHPGNDHATFTATGVLDSNCPVSTGGTEVWIKPGDSIDFDSALAGINVASIPLNIGKVVGLTVSATVDGSRTTFTVPAGGTKAITSASLPEGDQALYWHLDSITILPVVSSILGTVLGPATTVSLSPGNLNSGASLSWNGVIHVTDSAPTCKLAVGIPEAKVSLGPVKVTVPPVSVGVPLPTLPNATKLPVPGPGSKSPGPGGHGSSTSGVNYTPPGLTIPDEVVPKGYGAGSGGGSAAGGVGFGNAQPGSGGQGVGVAAAPGSHNGYVDGATPAAAKVKRNSADLATSTTPSAQMPVLLAIIAVIALSLVTAAYARMYLLRKPN